VFAAVKGDEPVEIAITLPALKDAKPQARRALLASADDELNKPL
jgi:hypothetical protein